MRQEIFENSSDDYVIEKAAIHISVDPITGIKTLSAFTDDGRGNGEHLFTVRYAELLKIAFSYAKFMDGE